MKKEKTKHKPKGKVEIEPELQPFKLPPRADVPKDEFLRRLRNIGEWRKQHLATFWSKSPR